MLAGSGNGWQRWSPNAGRSCSASQTKTATSLPKMPLATATRSGARCRWACRWRSRIPSRSHWSNCCAGTRAPTGRSCRSILPGASVCRSIASRARWARSRPRNGSSSASSDLTVWPANGARSMCSASSGDGLWRRCGARSSRSSRRRWPDSWRCGTASPVSAGAPKRSSKHSASSKAQRS